MSTQTANNPYLRTKILTASPEELRMMLLDGAVRFAERAKEGLQRKDFEQAYDGFSRVQGIVMELLNSLRPEHAPDLCEKLASLYTYIYMELVRSCTERNVERLSAALDLLRYERDTWALALERLGEERRNGAATVDDVAAQAAAIRDAAAQNGGASRLNMRG
jgi:flagellar protein FliS